MNRTTCTVLTAGALALIAGAAGPLATFADGIYTVPATSNPWLAGQPEGISLTTVFGGIQYKDDAPACCPPLVASPAIAPGAVLNFLVTGAASNGPTHPLTGPDGHATSKPDNFGWPVFDLANVRAPLNALMGVFLSDATPNTEGEAPPNLDFSTAASIDFAALTPQLKQVFFIGDGLRADGFTLQNFVVPAGATRLYLGVMDGYEWSNNVGGYSVCVDSTVPAPGALAGLGLGAAALSARRRRRINP